MKHILGSHQMTMIFLGSLVVGLLFLLTNFSIPTHLFQRPPVELIDDLPKEKFKRVVVISANENPFYSFYAPLVAWTWKHRIGIDALVIMTRNVPPLIIEAIKWAGGTPILVDITWPTGTGKMMQHVRTLAATLREYIDDDTVVTTGDADLFPLNRTYFQLQEKMNDRLVVHGNHPATIPMNQYPLCYLSMTAKLWRVVMELGDLTLNEALVRMYFIHADEIASNIYFDQDDFYRKVQSYRKVYPAFQVTLVPWYNEMRLDFRIWRNLNFSNDKSWIDAPALRPGFTKDNWPRFREGLMKDIFDEVTMNYFESFKERYLRDVMKGDDQALGLKDGFGRQS